MKSLQNWSFGGGGGAVLAQATIRDLAISLDDGIEFSLGNSSSIFPLRFRSPQGRAKHDSCTRSDRCHLCVPGGQVIWRPISALSAAHSFSGSVSLRLSILTLKNSASVAGRSNPMRFPRCSSPLGGAAQVRDVTHACNAMWYAATSARYWVAPASINTGSSLSTIS